MTAPALSLVPLGAWPEPEQPLLGGPWSFRAIVHEDRHVVAARSARAERPPVWRNPLRTRRVTGAEDLLAWRAPAHRAPVRTPPTRRTPVRPRALQVWAPPTAVALPRSRRRRRHVQRQTMAGESHETLGNRPLTRAERADLAADMEHLAGVRFGPPEDDRDCPTGPCPSVGCRYHLYLDVDGDRTTLNWPGRHVDELEETCSLRAARAAVAERQESGRPDEPAMSFAEVGRMMNLTAESVRQDLIRAIEKLRAGGVTLGD